MIANKWERRTGSLSRGQLGNRVGVPGHESLWCHIVGNSDDDFDYHNQGEAGRGWTHQKGRQEEKERGKAMDPVPMDRSPGVEGHPVQLFGRRRREGFPPVPLIQLHVSHRLRKRSFMGSNGFVLLNSYQPPIRRELRDISSSPPSLYPPVIPISISGNGIINIPSVFCSSIRSDYQLYLHWQWGGFFTSLP